MFVYVGAFVFAIRCYIPTCRWFCYLASWEEGTVEAAAFDAEPDFFRCTKYAQEYQRACFDIICGRFIISIFLQKVLSLLGEP